MNKGSYKTKVDTQNVLLYFSFLEASLKQAYNRLHSVSAFITADEGQLTERMYPFALLNKEAREKISNIFTKAVNLANSLDVSGIDPDFQSLCEEKHLGNSASENNSN